MDANEQARMVRRLEQAGILAGLPGDLPLPSSLHVLDALLAAPVLGVMVQGTAVPADAARLITDLRQRGRENWLVGVDGVETAVAADAFIDAGAQIVTSPRLDLALMAHCLARGVFYLPGVISLLAAQAAQQAGCAMVQLRTGGPSGPDYVKQVRKLIPELPLLVTGDVSPLSASAYAAADASAALVGAPLYAGPQQTMAEIITNARQLQRAWEEGCQQRPSRGLFAGWRPQRPSLS